MSKADRDKLALLRELNPAAEKFRLLRELHPEFDRQLERQSKIDLFEEARFGGEVSVRAIRNAHPTIGVKTSNGVAPKMEPGIEKQSRPGPKTDTVTAEKVAGIVKRVAGFGRWQDMLDHVFDGLDDEKITPPKTWRNRQPPLTTWADATTGSDRQLARKAIAHHLENAKRVRGT